MWRRAPRCPRAGASGMTATSCCTGRTVWTSSRRRCARATDPRASSRPLGAAPAAARGETRLAASVAPGVSDLSRAAADDARGNVGEIHPEAPGRRAAPEARDDGSRGARVLHRVRLHALAQSGPPAPQRAAAPHFRYAQWRLRDVARAVAPYNVITALDVFEHLSDPLAAAKWLRTQLAPGGVLHWNFVGNPLRNDLDLATEAQREETCAYLYRELELVWERDGYRVSRRR